MLVKRQIMDQFFYGNNNVVFGSCFIHSNNIFLAFAKIGENNHVVHYILNSVFYQNAI